MGKDGIPRAAETRLVENVSAQNKDVGDCSANQNGKVGTESQRPKRLRKLPKKFKDYV